MAAPLLSIPITALKPSPDNPRSSLGDLDELTQSIRSLGVVVPLIVVPADECYTVVSGHRRLAAAVVVGLTELPVVIRDDLVDPAELAIVRLAESLLRKDLSPLDEGHAYKVLIGMGLTQRDIAARVGRNQSHICRRLLLLDLPAPVRDRVHARQLGPFNALAKRDTPQRDALAESVEGDLASCYRQVRRLIETLEEIANEQHSVPDAIRAAIRGAQVAENGIVAALQASRRSDSATA